MILIKKSKKLGLFVALSVVAFGCNKDFHEVGANLFEDMTFETGRLTVPVTSLQQKLAVVQTDGLPIMQLGKITHPIFGQSEASFTSQFSIGATPQFGIFSQTREDEGSETDIQVIEEAETVTDVFLEIPFFNNREDDDNDGVINAFDVDPDDSSSDSDGDGISDLLETQSGLDPLNEDSDGDGILDEDDNDNEGYDAENKVYEVDSLYGNRQASFDLKVYELTYYLNSLDADNNFETVQQYYSDDDFFELGFYGEVLHDETIELNFQELRFNYEEDDEETPDVDETETVETRLTPRIRVPLNKDFFQTRFIDKEGSPELSSLTSLQQYLKGIIIRTENFSDELYMLLDLNNAIINIEYDYQSYNVKGTPEDESDDTVDTLQKTFSIALGGIQINNLRNDSFDGTIENQIEAGNRGEAAKRLYLKGGDLHGVIRLFEDENNNQDALLSQLRSNPWLINEANLVFYVAPESGPLIDKSLFASRIYLYNIEDGIPLTDYILDGNLSLESVKKNKQNFGGILEYDDTGKPYRYKFRITDHVSKILRKDSVNVDLGLVVTGDINSVVNKKGLLAPDQTQIEYPQAALLDPLGIVLFGSGVESNFVDKTPRLELIYTEY